MSIRFLNDSLHLASILENIEDEKRDLQKYFDVRTITFGRKVCDTCAFEFNESSTNLSNVFDFIRYSFPVDKPQALVLATDGLFNSGESYEFTRTNQDYPIFSLVLADTITKNDFWIANLRSNQQVPLNSRFEVEFDIQRTSIDPKTVMLEVSLDGKMVLNQSVTFPKGEKRIKFSHKFLADQTGIRKYEVKLISTDEESNINNNKALFVVEVVETQEKFLFLYGAPHPDVAIIRRAISQVDGYSVDIMEVQNFNGDFSSYKAIIMSGLPNGDFSSDRHVVEAIRQNRSIWFLVTSQTNLTMLSQLNPSWKFIGQRKIDAAYFVPNSQFEYFQISPLWESITEIMPPLSVPFGKWTVTNPSEIIFTQKVGRVTTENPLMVISNFGVRKAALLVGEGLWRWNIHMRRNLNSATALEDLILQVIRYLSTKPFDQPFYLTVEPVWSVNESPVVKGFVFNQTNELINNKPVEVILSDSSNSSSRTFSMHPHKNHYQTALGYLPTGIYTLTGIYKTDSITYFDRKSFVVVEQNPETLSSFPDIERLENISGNDNVFLPNELKNLADSVIRKINPKSQVQIISEITDVIGLKSLLFLFMVCITFEWILRKYFGYR